MTQPEETTAALVARLHEENRIAYSELARLTHIGAQEAAERERLKRERDEQRARADKAERWLKHTSEREMKLDADLAKASERVQGLANELDQERLKSQALLKFKNIWLDRCTKARKERDEFRASHAALDRLLAERTRERDEARACYGSVCAQLSEQKQSYAKLLDLRDRLTRERDNAREQLAKLEWAGKPRAGQQHASYNASFLGKTCPSCHQVEPSDNARENFTADQIGHRPTCWFAKKDKQVTIPAKTLKADDVAFCVRFRTDGLPGTAIVMKQETVDTTKDATLSVTVTESEPARCSLCLEPEVTGKPHPHARCKDRDSSTREPARPEPRFRVGEKVIWRDKEAVITWAEWFPPVRVWCYGSTYSSSPMPEPELKPAPKFAVGELVTLGGGEAGEIRSREWTMNRWHYRVNDLLCAEHCIAAQTPQHKHDCKGGVFLGRMGNKDLYYSTVGSGFVGGPWLVVIGNRLYHECNIDRPTGPEHDEARRRAVARGLVK